MLLFTRISPPRQNNRPHARFFHSSLASSLVHELSPIYHLLAGVISPPYCQAVLQPPCTPLPSPITTTFQSATNYPRRFNIAPLMLLTKYCQTYDAQSPFPHTPIPVSPILICPIITTTTQPYYPTTHCPPRPYS